MENYTYFEVNQILNKLGENYIKRIPKKVYNLICEKSNMIDDRTKELYSKCKISKKAVSFVALLHLYYWSDSEEEKQELMKIFKDNERKKEERLMSKYNENIFEKKIKAIENQQENTQILNIEKEKWYIKVIKFVSKIFKIN